MGTILEFRHGEDAAARIAKPVDGSLGQIIIFPACASTAGPATPRRAPRRAGAPSAAARNSRADLSLGIVFKRSLASSEG